MKKKMKNEMKKKFDSLDFEEPNVCVWLGTPRFLRGQETEAEGEGGFLGGFRFLEGKGARK